MLQRILGSNEWKFFSSLRYADRRLAAVWWTVLIGRGVLPALLALASGLLVAAVNNRQPLAAPLVFVGILFVAFQVLTPVHKAIGNNLGNRLSAWLNDRLMQACTKPQGMAHLERPELMKDLSVARDFDLGIMGPPLFIAMDFIASGLVELVAGLAAGILLLGFAWWAPPLLLAGWGSTHWLLRESAVWRDRNTNEVRDAQRHADYAYRLAVDPPAAKELRLFGLAQWVVDRFARRRQRLYELRWQATRLREKSVLSCLLVVVTANALVFWAIAVAAADGRISPGAVVVYLQAAIGTSAIAFGGLSWALDGAAAPVAAVLRLEAAMDTVGALKGGGRSAAKMPAHEIRFRGVTFAYESSSRPVLDKFDLTIPAGTSLAIVGVNGAGKTTLAKLLCRLYDPQSGAIAADGVDLRDLDIAEWRGRVAAVLQDFVRYELPLRDNVARRRRRTVASLSS